MRLIDADALIDNIPQADLNNDKKISKCGAIADMVLLVCDAPTIDAMPVVRGEWRDTYISGYKPNAGSVCSKCDCWSHRRSNYCPNCGAKMEDEPCKTKN